MTREGNGVMVPPQGWPAHLIDVVELGDGRRAIVRPVLPRDAPALRAFFAALSDEARYFRFMTRLRELPEALALRFADVDYSTRMGLLAEHFHGDRRSIVGEAQYAANTDDPGTCEFAIAVADDWQRRGLARTLLQRLVHHASASGLRRMAADTLAGNQPMIGLAASTGFSVGSNAEDARLRRLSRNLRPPHAPPALAA